MPLSEPADLPGVYHGTSSGLSLDSAFSLAAAAADLDDLVMIVKYTVP